MSKLRALPEHDPSVSLSLQNLIDTRFDTSYPTQNDVRGLSPLQGQIQARHRGQGLEFDDLRAYSSGDDVRHIDWKVSARHNQLHTRLYREEKEQRITLALDFTSTMFTGSNELRAVQAGRLAANLAWHETGAGSRCGLMIQTDNDLTALPAALGDKAALNICAEIAKTFTSAKAAAMNDRTTTFARTIIDRLRGTGREAGAVIVLSGLDTIHDPFRQHLQALHAGKQIAVICIEDALEYNAIAPGQYQFKSGNKKSHITLGDAQTQHLQQRLSEQTRELDKMFLDIGVPLLRSRRGFSQTRASLHELGFIT